MNIEQWAKDNLDIIREELGDLSVSKVARLLDDDLALGEYIREQIENRYRDYMEATYLPREPDTERMAEARAINAEMRRAV